jgi:chorismate mutase
VRAAAIKAARGVERSDERREEAVIRGLLWRGFGKKPCHIIGASLQELKKSVI